MSRLGNSRALDEALDRLLAGEDPDAHVRIAPLLQTAAAIQSVLTETVDPATQAAHLALLEAGTGAPRTEHTLRRRIAVVGLAATMAFTLLSGVAFAVSQEARPGEPLFGVKRAFERAGFAMHRGHGSRATFALKLVGRRLAELRAAAGNQAATDAARAAYEEALAEVEMRLLSNGQPVVVDGLLDDAEEELRHNVVVLNDLLGTVPTQAQSAIQRALDRASEAREFVSKGRARRNDPAHRPRRVPDRSSRGSRG